jgi:septum formation protein
MVSQLEQSIPTPKIFMFPPLILASQSPVRATMLHEAGIVFTVLPSPYDEDTEKEQIAHLSPDHQAAHLARGKAQAVSTLHPEAYVIGADQICAMGAEIFGKPATFERAVLHLSTLQGTTHFQHSAACVYHQGACVWEAVETVILNMKPLDASAIRAYLTADMPLNACGAYAYEKTGHTLFASVQGSSAAIKGLPLDGLLGFLKSIA